MSGLKHLRNRIKTIKSTKKITKAMQVVSASKLRRVKDKAEAFDDYSNILSDIMNDIRLNAKFVELTPNESKFFCNNSAKKSCLLVVMTSERGLCGSFNSQITKSVRNDIAKFKAQDIKVKLLVVGKKGYDALKGMYADLIIEYCNIEKENFLPISIQVKEKIVGLVESDQIDSCYLYYNEFKNALTQIMTKRQILPVEVQQKQELQNRPSNYEYEGLELIDNLINLYITGVIKYGFLQNKASEEAARMTAMDNATRNASELMDKLTLKLNRSRQAIITTELTEIISGAEAL